MKRVYAVADEVWSGAKDWLEAGRKYPVARERGQTFWLEQGPFHGSRSFNWDREYAALNGTRWRRVEEPTA